MKTVLVSLLGALCLGQENVHIPIFRGPSGWHVNVSVDAFHHVYPVLSFRNRHSVFDISGSNGPRMISLQNDITGDRGSSVDIFYEDLRTFEGATRTARISKLSIDNESRIFLQMGPIAIIKNPIDSTAGDLVLRSTIEEFEASCLNDSIVYLQNAETVRTRIYAGEDEDLWVGDSPYFTLDDTQILSIPETAFRRYVEKIVGLGAVEAPPSDSGSTVLINNCTIGLVAQLPPIRVHFEQTGNPYIEFASEDLILVNQATRTCRLVLGVSDANEVALNPSRVPFMNVRIGGKDGLHLCHSVLWGSHRPAPTDAPTSQEAEESFPLVFSAQGGHIMVQVDNNGSSVVDMIVTDSAVTRVCPEDIVSNSESLITPAFSLRGIPSGQIVDERLSSVGGPRLRSQLAVGYASWILDQFRSVAVIRNTQNTTMGSLVLRSTFSSFAASCVPGTLNSHRYDQLVNVHTVSLNLGTSDRFAALVGRSISFRFGTISKSHAVAFVNQELYAEINRFLTELGAIDTNQREPTTLFRNCSSDMVSRLPSMQLQFKRGGPPIELLVSDYVTRDDDGNRCHVLLAPHIGAGASAENTFILLPFRIPSLNTRISSDEYIQVCRNTVPSPVFGLESIKGASPRNPLELCRSAVTPSAESGTIAAPLELDTGPLGDRFARPHGFVTSEHPRRRVMRLYSIGGADAAYPVRRGFPGTRGVLNLGLTCYFGATLQVLSHSSKFRQFLESNPSMNPNAVETQLRAFMERMWAPENDEGVLNPIEAFTAFSAPRERQAEFRIGRMSDAHEALAFILDDIATALKSADAPFHARSNLDRLFAIEDTQRLECLECGNVSATRTPLFEMFLNIPEIPAADFVTLNDCFGTFARDETIAGYACETCSPSRHDARQVHRITNTSDILTIALRRFTWENNIKIGTSVEIPMILNMTEVPGSETNDVYQLIGVVNHFGRTRDGGHYTAFVHNSIQNRWMRMDDSFTEHAADFGTQPTFRSSEAYILIYERMNHIQLGTANEVVEVHISQTESEVAISTTPLPPASTETTTTSGITDAPIVSGSTTSEPSSSTLASPAARRSRARRLLGTIGRWFSR